MSHQVVTDEHGSTLCEFYDREEPQSRFGLWRSPIPLTEKQWQTIADTAFAIQRVATENAGDVPDVFDAVSGESIDGVLSEFYGMFLTQVTDIISVSI